MKDTPPPNGRRDTTGPKKRYKTSLIDRLHITSPTCDDTQERRYVTAQECSNDAALALHCAKDGAQHLLQSAHLHLIAPPTLIYATLPPYDVAGTSRPSSTVMAVTYCCAGAHAACRHTAQARIQRAESSRQTSVRRQALRHMSRARQRGKRGRRCVHGLRCARGAKDMASLPFSARACGGGTAEMRYGAYMRQEAAVQKKRRHARAPEKAQRRAQRLLRRRGAI